MAMSSLKQQRTDLLDELDPPELGSDVTACDREQIHIPGSIQPHGLLLVADVATLRVRAGAGNVEERLSPNWLDVPLTDLLGHNVTAALAEMHDTDTTVDLHQIALDAGTYDVVAHRVADQWIVELEPALACPSMATTVLSILDAASTSFERAINLREVCDRAAGWFRKLTGYDRVMVYQFLDDDAGVVLAEDRDPTLSSFVNHHFPASDIPKQARALYVRNRVRAIPDVGYTPAFLRPASETMCLDMSDVGLRSVSPVHVQYLKNMGVAASASISIVKDGLLWGLIACHNVQPKRLPYEVRMICKTLASGLARQIKIKEDATSYQERISLRSSEDIVVAHLGNQAFLNDFLADAGNELCAMMNASGFAAIQGKDLYFSGDVPDRIDIQDIAQWVRKRAAARPFSTHSLSDELREARDYQAVASGLLAVTMSAEEPIILMWFRAEVIEQIKWAGNPHKAVAVDLNATLTPRTSFEAWSQTVKGRSRRWTLNEIEAANRLKRIMLEAQQNRRIRELNQELTILVAEKGHLLEQKDYLMKEVNHRVQNSLMLVSAFLAMQARSANNAALSDSLNEAQRRLSAVALVHRRLHQDDHVSTVDLARYLDELCTEMKTTMGAEWQDLITLELTPLLISTDRAVHVGLVLTELVINANKYAYGGGVGPIAISLEQHRNRFRLTVADRGPGKKGSTRQGFGSRMMRGMVEQLSGDLEETSNDPGLRVVLTAPLDEVDPNRRN